MKRLLACISVCMLLVSCSGVPLRSIPKLLQLNSQLLEANPAEFTVALQVDVRLAPPPDAVPLLIIKVTPSDAAAFAAVDKKLPLQLAVAQTATMGLDAPPVGRHWLVYSLPPSTQAELQAIQATLRKAKADPARKSGGTLSMGVEQSALAGAVTDPSLVHTRWETWLQTRKADGFFEVWSGTAAQLQALGNSKK